MDLNVLNILNNMNISKPRPFIPTPNRSRITEVGNMAYLFFYDKTTDRYVRFEGEIVHIENSGVDIETGDYWRKTIWRNIRHADFKLPKGPYWDLRKPNIFDALRKELSRKI